jgi:hypothetical protein
MRTRQLQFFLLILATMLFVACQSEPEPEPTPPPTPTRQIIVPRNDNVEALNAAQAALDKINFGFAPLLRLDEARVTLTAEQPFEDESARLEYPEQPADPAQWTTMDSFVSAYAVRRLMLNLPQVSRIALGRFGVAGSIGDMAEDIEHVAAWITFSDGSRAVVDLTPLSTNFAARHAPDRMMVDNNQIESQFIDRRRGVNLDEWQPMLIVEQTGELYYVVARVLVSYHRYKFTLRIHPVEPANPMEPMSFRPGASAEVEIDRTEFEALQRLLTDAGPTAFEQHPELLQRAGVTRQPLVSILDDQLELLWHLIVKFEHEPPNPTRATPTPVPTATPIPTPTPTPTATPKKLPLITS